MCIFRRRKLNWHRTIEEENAIVGYRVMTLTATGIFESPVQGTRWLKDTRKEKKITGTADVYSPRFNPGIHCMNSKTGATNTQFVGYRHVLVRVLMWGDMYYYSGRKPGYDYSSGYPGYLAQNVRIDAIVKIGGTRPTALKSMRKRYPNVKVEVDA